MRACSKVGRSGLVPAAGFTLRGSDHGGIRNVSSNPDSFIEEVTEAVRRDRLFAFFRRYGWIGVVAIIGIVGFSAWSEWSKRRAEAEAQAFGDAVVAALETDGQAAQAQALSAIPTRTAEQRALIAFLTAEATQDTSPLAQAAADAELARHWRDLAVFKRLTASPDLPEAERIAGFEAMTGPGAPFRLLAIEQLALIDISAGRAEQAMARFRSIADDTEASAGLRRRAGQMIVALGGTVGG